MSIVSCMENYLDEAKLETAPRFFMGIEREAGKREREVFEVKIHG